MVLIKMNCIMKKNMYLILLSAVVFILSMFYTELGLSNSSVEIKRPSHLPKNIPHRWSSFEQEAYDDGRLSYNADSTICVIEENRKLTKEHGKRIKQYNEYFDKWNSDSAQKAREKNPTWYMREYQK